MLVPGRFERRCRAGNASSIYCFTSAYIEADDTNLASVNVAGIISQGSGDTDHAIVLVMSGDSENLRRAINRILS